MNLIATWLQRFPEISSSTLVGSLVGIVIGAVGFLQSVEFLNAFLTEDRIVWEIQQDVHNGDTASMQLRLVSDKNFALDSLKFRTQEPATVTFQYADLKTPVPLLRNEQLEDYSYIISKEQLADFSKQPHLLFESQQKSFLFIESKAPINFHGFSCEFVGVDLSPDIVNTRMHNIECGVEKSGYITLKGLKQYILNSVAAILMLFFVIMGIILLHLLYKKAFPPRW